MSIAENQKWSATSEAMTHVPSQALAQVAVACAVAFGYFLASRFALAHLSGSAGVALLWPASGLAAGLLLATARRWHTAIAVGTLIGTLIANMENGRPADQAVAFGLINMGEAMMTRCVFDAGLALFQRKQGFASQLSEVFALFIAALVAAASAAAIAAFVIFATAKSPIDPLPVWSSWLLADFVGIVCLAPLIKAVGYSIVSRTTIPDWSRDLALLILFTGTIALPLSYTHGSQSWISLAPGATVLPILIWLSARSHPAVPASAVVLLAILIIVFARIGLGRYGDASIPIETRMLGAQATLSAVSFATAVISALYAERRAAAAKVRDAEQQLSLIAETTPGSIFSLERDASARCRFSFVGGSSTQLIGLDPKQLDQSAGPFLDKIADDDRQTLLDAFTPTDPLPEQIRLEVRLNDATSHDRWIEISAKPLLRADGTVTWHGFLQDVTVRRRMIEEMAHRTRNLLNIVRYMASSTMTSDPASFQEHFGKRIQALAASQDLLAEKSWNGVSLDALIRSQLAHLTSDLDRRIHLAGPDLTVNPRAAQIIGMAIHELSTNACKHGALTGAAGEVRIGWTVTASGGPSRFRIAWDESGGPPLDPNARHGFGHNVTVKLLAYELSADVVLDGRPTGMHWHMETDLLRIVHGKPKAVP